jgi:class 3 adenylate cyclase
MVIHKYGLEKLKTIGDSYMIGGGFPIETKDHAINIIKAAIDMLEIVKGRNTNSSYEWKMRTGVHSGNIVAGVVGKIKYSYDVWGKTVNVANIMERLSSPGKINITAATYELIKNEFDCEYRGVAEISGDESIKMYFVNGYKSKIHLSVK